VKDKLNFNFNFLQVTNTRGYG